MNRIEELENEAKERRIPSGIRNRTIQRRLRESEAAVDELIAMVRDKPLVAELAGQLLKCMEERDEARALADQLAVAVNAQKSLTYDWHPETNCIGTVHDALNAYEKRSWK